MCQNPVMVDRTPAELARAALDVLDASVVVIDRSGQIVLANDTWRTFGEQNGAGPVVWTERNYLDECIRAAGDGEEDAAVVLAALRQVLDGRVTSRRYVYDCSSPDQERFYGVTITGLAFRDAPHAVVSHENVTNQRFGAAVNGAVEP